MKTPKTHLILTALLIFAGCGDNSSKKTTVTPAGKGGTSSAPATTSSGTNNQNGNANGNYTYTAQPGAPATSIPPANTGGVTAVVPGGNIRAGQLPTACGDGEYPRGELCMTYTLDGNGQVAAQGHLTVEQDYGFGDCRLPKGRYGLNPTIKKGISKSDLVYNFQNIVMMGSGDESGSPVHFEFTVTNALVAQNIKGEFNQHATLQLKSINEKDCYGMTMHFYIPFEYY